MARRFVRCSPRGLPLLVATFLLGGTTEAHAFEAAQAHAQAACIARSLKLGATKTNKTLACYQDRAAHLRKIKSRRSKQRGLGLDADLRLGLCPSHFAIDRVPSLEDSDDVSELKLSKSYLERFQKRLIPYGKRIANCYASLAKETLKPAQFKKGRVVIELEVDSFGRARQVVLIEETDLDAHVSGCVVRELCGFSASPPPSGHFYLELPFTFKKPKDFNLPTAK